MLQTFDVPPVSCPFSPPIDASESGYTAHNCGRLALMVSFAKLKASDCCALKPPCSSSPRSVGAASHRLATAAMSANYSLWIKPAGVMYDKLQNEISTQAEQYDAPLFEPHVTLLPDIQGDQEQIVHRTKELADSLKKFRINFLNVAQGGSFHKCIYILVAKEAAVMDAGAAAQQTFGKATADYMPHLSLLYADIDDDTKAASQQAAVQRLYGEGSDYSTLLSDNGFMAESISLWYTPVDDKTLASWKQVAEFQLKD